VALFLLQNHIEFQIVTPRTLAAFRGTSLILPDVSVMDDDERKQTKAFVSGGGSLVILGRNDTNLEPTPRITQLANDPAADFYAALQKDFAANSRNPPDRLAHLFHPRKDLAVHASAFVATNIALVDGNPHIFFANFAGLVPHQNLRPTAESTATITVPISPKQVLHFLPFLGEEQTISARPGSDSQVFSLPPFERGAVAWLEKTP
jgi:hypothetical protein